MQELEAKPMENCWLMDCFLWLVQPTCLGLVLPKVDCALLHQVEIKKKMPHSYTYRPVWFSHFFNGGSLFPSVSSWHLKVAMTPVYTLVLCFHELSASLWVWSFLEDGCTISLHLLLAFLWASASGLVIATQFPAPSQKRVFQLLLLTSFISHHQ